MISLEEFKYKYANCFLCGSLNSGSDNLWRCLNCRVDDDGLWASYFFQKNILSSCSITSPRFEVLIQFEKLFVIKIVIFSNREPISYRYSSEPLDNFLNKEFIQNLFQTLDLFS